MFAAESFHMFGASHLAVLALTAAAVGLLPLLALHGGEGRWPARAAVVLAGILVAAKAGGFAVRLSADPGRWRELLPMHLCDWAAVAVVVALLVRRQRPAELAYFWGLAGTLQAILTPDLAHDFPHLDFILFFVSHCGIVVGVVLLVFALGLRPERGAVWRAYLWSNGYLLAAAAVNGALGTNYGYLCAKPRGGSLLDWLGPWPWYLLSLEMLALLLFGLLHWPFRALAQHAPKKRAPRESP